MAPMAEGEQQGVVFPETGEGRRSTTVTGRAIVADALREVDPSGAVAAEQETNWRRGYLAHLRRLLVAGLEDREAAVSVARNGLASARERMRVAAPDGDRSLAEWPAANRIPGTTEVSGTADPVTELVLPYRGQRLRGSEIQRQVDTWVGTGVAEPSLAEAIDKVLANPDWLRLDGHTVVVLGAGSEMGPLPSLMRWGARAVAVDLDVPAIRDRVGKVAREGAGSLSMLPADLLTDVPAVAEALTDQPGRLVLGNYVYADGATNLRLSVAADELARRVQEERDDVALAFLATPTDVFAVPGEAVDFSTTAYERRSTRSKVLGRPLRTLSGGRLLHRNYVPGSDPGINDALVPQQGPNYALAKRLHRWRATASRADRRTVSMNIAPPTRTRSVVKNRALAAAYAGAHRFGVEVFEPSTSNVLMAALLVHDLHTDGGPRHDHPWQDEAYAAVHGGLWRTGYAPRSALGLAALLGYGAARG